MKGVQKCCIPNRMDETDDDMLWDGSEEDRNVSVRMMNALTVKMGTVTLIGKRR